ncbi:MAG: 50S ribosomal protein L32 [Verrucomicrobiae bacterium]|nr:50S ribosomal protein L32 [Verrucomicrobiae bacterium]MCX7914745.1 50S ribosomal protein L32 [Verrucomicrobiae bacterium]MDW8344600.1 50S ribosomal protein L32 [Verrucomicrobiae bacterium]
MGVPKRRSSHQRMATRRAANAYRAPQLGKCPQCGARVLPHRVCPACGFYKGRQVKSVTTA